jgi:hypothetical protein
MLLFEDSWTEKSRNFAGELIELKNAVEKY